MLNLLKCSEMTACHLHNFKLWLLTSVVVYAILLWKKTFYFVFFFYRWEAGSPRENVYQVDKHSFEESENCLFSTAKPINVFNFYKTAQDEANMILKMLLTYLIYLFIFTWHLPYKPITTTKVLKKYHVVFLCVVAWPTFTGS